MDEMIERSSSSVEAWLKQPDSSSKEALSRALSLKFLAKVSLSTDHNLRWVIIVEVKLEVENVKNYFSDHERLNK